MQEKIASFSISGGFSDGARAGWIVFVTFLGRAAHSILTTMAFPLLKSSPIQRRISLAFGLFGAAAFIFWIGYLWINRSYVSSEETGYFESFISVLIYVPLATLLTYRRPENPISWLIMLFTFLRLYAIPRHIILVSLMKGAAPVPMLLLGVNAWPWLSGLTFSFLAYAFAIFPNGKLLGPRWRFVRWLLGFQMVSTFVWITLFSLDLFRSLPAKSWQAGGIELVPMGTGPLSLALVVRPLAFQNIFLFSTAATALCLIVSGLVSQVLRFRRGNPVERQQIKWVTFVMALWAFSVIGIAVPSDLSFALLAFVSPLPGIAITLAIFRYRLYDIDIIIRRTLSYSILSAVLALVYFGAIVLFQKVFGGLFGDAESPLVTVLSTLIIAALFNPLRSRIQVFIDRRFFRAKYDAEKALTEFAAIARDEVDMVRLSSSLLSVIDTTMQPEQTSLWLRDSANGN